MTITTAPKNALSQIINSTGEKAEQPNDQQERIGYGEIEKVNPTTSKVVVKMYDEVKGDFTILKGKPVPVIQPLTYINHLYGALSPGMKVKIYWKGRNEPKNAFVEIIGAEDFNLKDAFIKEPEANRQDTTPYLTLSGGTVI